MSFIVKICGLSTPEALEAALDAGADMVGFVFFPPSPRHLAFETAHALGRRVRGRAQKVALTVDADDALLTAIVAALQARYAPASRPGAAGARRRDRAEFGLPVMKAIAVAAKGDLGAVRDLRGGRRPAPVRRARAA